MFKSILKTIIIVTASFIGASGQHNQFEGKFIFHPNQEKFNNTDGFGGGLELTTNLGEYIKLLQRFDIEKTRAGDSLRNFTQRDITFQSTFRLYPVEEYYTIKPFVQGGIRARNQRLKSSIAIPLPGDPGKLSTENKFTFTSPFIGVGVNGKDYYTLEYNYFLPDFSSKIVTDFFGNPDLTFFRERGHSLRAKAFIPLSDKFSFNPEYEVFRRQFEVGDAKYDHKIAFGLAYTFSSKKVHHYPPVPVPLPPEE